MSSQPYERGSIGVIRGKASPGTAFLRLLENTSQEAQKLMKTVEENQSVKSVDATRANDDEMSIAVYKPRIIAATTHNCESNIDKICTDWLLEMADIEFKATYRPIITKAFIPIRTRTEEKISSYPVTLDVKAANPETVTDQSIIQKNAMIEKYLDEIRGHVRL